MKNLGDGWLTVTQRPSAGTVTVVNSNNQALQWKTPLSSSPITLAEGDEVEVSAWQSCTTPASINFGVSAWILAVPTTLSGYADAVYGQDSSIYTINPGWSENLIPAVHHYAISVNTLVKCSGTPGNNVVAPGTYVFNLTVTAYSAALSGSSTTTMSLDGGVGQCYLSTRHNTPYVVPEEPEEPSPLTYKKLGQAGGLVDIDLANPSGTFDVYGVIRNVGSGFFFIDDATHAPENFASISTVNGSSTSGYVRVTYSQTASKVGSLVVTADETFTKQGYAAGASVGVSYADIHFAQNGSAVSPNSISSSNGNFWILGIMHS